MPRSVSAKTLRVIEMEAAGISRPEIAEATGLKRGTISSIIHRDRRGPFRQVVAISPAAAEILSLIKRLQTEAYEKGFEAHRQHVMRSLK